MSCELRLSGSPQGDHVTDLCTNAGFSALCDWIGSLPRDDYPASKAFAAAGRIKNTAVLAIELNRAFAEHPPTDTDVTHTADRFLNLLGSGHPDERVSIA